MSQGTEQWKSRWGFIAAGIGMAIGTGNIWRFPRMVANNGGFPFIIAWTIALFVWAIPLLIGELVMGRKTRLGNIGAFRDFAGKGFTWMGTWQVAVCLLIMSYYSVVMGWCAKYFTLAATGAFAKPLDLEATKAIWTSFTTTPVQTILFHLISMGIGGFIIYRGVVGGIEKASKIMIPALFALLIIAAVRALTLPGAAQGLEFLFAPKFERLADPKLWLDAFTQAAWSTGAGWGFMVVYANYQKKRDEVVGNAFIMGIGDNVGALMAGMVVLPAVFALSLSPQMANDALTSGNTGLAFLYLAQLFTRIPLGSVFAAIFFLAMTIAALSSLLPMIEVGVKNLIDAGMDRKKATIAVAVGGFLVGVPSAYSINFLDNQDWVWGVGLFVSGLFVAIALMKHGIKKVHEEYINTPWTDFKAGAWWKIFIMAFPVLFVLIFGWWVYQSITWYPDNWMAPLEVFSVGTILMQFAALLIVALLTNNWLAKKIQASPGSVYDEK